MTSPDRRAPLLAVAGAALWGTTGTSQALLAGHHSPVAVGALRAVVAACCLVVLSVATARGTGRMRRAMAEGRWRWLVLGGVAVAGYQLTFFAAVAATGVGVGTLVMLATAPAVAGLLGWVVHRERPSRTWALATTVGLAGAALLVLGAGARQVDVTGLLLAVAAGASFATYSLAGRSAVAHRPAGAPGAGGVDGLAATAVVFVVASAVLAVPLARAELAFVTAPRNLAVLAWLGTMATAAAYLLYQAAMRHIAAATAATLALAEPAVANLLAVVVLHERFTATMGLGMLLVLAGLGLLGRA